MATLFCAFIYQSRIMYVKLMAFLVALCLNLSNNITD